MGIHLLREDSAFTGGNEDIVWTADNGDGIWWPIAVIGVDKKVEIIETVPLNGSWGTIVAMNCSRLERLQESLVGVTGIDRTVGPALIGVSTSNGKGLEVFWGGDLTSRISLFLSSHSHFPTNSFKFDIKSSTLRSSSLRIRSSNLSDSNLPMRSSWFIDSKTRIRSSCSARRFFNRAISSSSSLLSVD